MPRASTRSAKATRTTAEIESPPILSRPAQVAVGTAVVSINSEDEISFSIRDGAGREVMDGKLNNYRGTGATAEGTLASWSCTLHDNTAELAGYGPRPQQRGYQQCL
jgi:hypothetical protein